MPRRILVVLLLPVLMTVLLTVLPTTSALAQPRSGSGYVSQESKDAANDAFHRFEVLMEGGLALPVGNLGAELLSEDAAMGAEAGYMLGLRMRIYLSRAFSLAPVFSYTEFGDYDGRDANDEVFTILARVLRYGLDATFIKPGSFKRVRPYVGGGVAVVRNKYREDYVEDETFYADGLNGFAWSLQAGLRWRDWELAAEYQRNTFSTARFLPTGIAVDYDWSQVTVRVAYALPRI